jgi:hypothetical protein
VLHTRRSSLNTLKTCTKCNKEKENSKFAFSNKKKGTLRSRCKECDNSLKRQRYEKYKKTIKKYQQDNTKKIAETKKIYREKNSEKIKEYDSRYYEENHDKILAYSKEYRENNKEKIQKQKRDHYKRNKERINKSCREYKYKNKAKIHNINEKRRIQKENATIPSSDINKIKNLYEKAKWLESVTGLKYSIDHVIPLNHPNVCGLHIWENLQILESSINMSKGNKLRPIPPIYPEDDDVDLAA